jgi:hypothetical protein
MQNQLPFPNNNLEISKRGFDTIMRDYGESNQKGKLLEFPKENLLGPDEVEESKQDYYIPINKESMMESNRKYKCSLALVG